MESSKRDTLDRRGVEWAEQGWQAECDTLVGGEAQSDCREKGKGDESRQLSCNSAVSGSETIRTGHVSSTLSPDRVAAIQSVMQERGESVFAALVVGWAVATSRWASQDQVVIGVILAGDVNGVFGEFAGSIESKVALRIRFEEGTLLSQVLHEVSAALLASNRNPDISLEEVMRDVRSSRAEQDELTVLMEIRPEAVFSLHSSAIGGQGVTTSEPFSGTGVNRRELLLSLRGENGSLVNDVEYDGALSDRRSIERLLACWETVIQEIASDTSRTVAALAILPRAERARILEEFNATQKNYPQGLLVQELFEAQARRTPEAIAVVAEGMSLTYRGLNERANQLARHLRERGVGADQLVGICVERSLEMVVGLFGILKAGGAYVPLDPGLPMQRLRYMLTDAAPKMLLTQAHLLPRLPESEAEVLALDEDWSRIEGQAVSDLDAQALGVSPRHLAYVIYTSGSTGEPKGAMNEHRGVVNRLQWMQDAYGLSAADRVLQKTPFSFDVSVWEFFWTLMSGAELVMARPDGHKDPSYLREVIERNAVTRLHFVPSMLQSFLAEPHVGECGSLKQVVCSGEELPRALQSQCFERLPQVRLSNLYGPTEAAVDVTFWECAAQEDTQRVPIGRPISNIRMYVLDRYGQPVPIGVAGEIYIGGIGVGRGYLNRPQLTQERFVSDPFSPDHTARMYKTGDLGRWREDGAIEYLGRNDHQVKIRGLRIELGEIEAQIVQDGQIRQAVVLCHEGAAGDKRLVAYVVAKETEDLSTRESVLSLRRRLAERLPEYMLPSAFVTLAQLPLSPNGKLDRKALPVPERHLQLAGEYKLPRGEVEEKLAQVWMQLLSLDRVSREDSFFDLGGHSLLALSLLVKIKQAFAVTLSIVDVYKQPTLRGLSSRIEGHVTVEERVDLETEAALDSDIVPCGRPRRLPERAILLTGATGFVGRFLLAQLLEDTQADIYCLVRAASNDQAALRLRATLKRWNLWQESKEHRVRAVAGDLCASRLGIERGMYARLSDDIDSIFHCGVSMNHLETYARAKPANVGSTKEIVKFAAIGRVKLINHISTLSVFADVLGEESRMVNEASSIDEEVHLTSQGYVASKWVSEKVLMTASQRGIPCNIFRLGLVWADANGHYDELQREHRIFKTCFLSGLGIRQYRYDVPPTPVDHVARAVVFLASRHTDGGGVFHIASAGQPMESVFERCNQLTGVSLTLLPFYEWLSAIKQLHLQGHTLPAVPLLEHLFSMDEDSIMERERSTTRAQIRSDCTATSRELERGGIMLAALDDAALEAYIERLLLEEKLRSLSRSEEAVVWRSGT